MAVFGTDPNSEGIRVISDEVISEALQKKTLLYDKAGEEHYNLISALHKSMRNSDPDAALYWLARMLEAGEDPLYVARRIIRFASEDVGLADPRHFYKLSLLLRQQITLECQNAQRTWRKRWFIYHWHPSPTACTWGTRKQNRMPWKPWQKPVPLHLRNALPD